jgi:glycosyltransferase involved in cell wall biosynthesis
MRILFCNYEYPPLGGGGGVVNAMLAENLAKRHEVTVLTSRAFGLPLDAVEHGVRVVRVPTFSRRLTAAANIPSMFAYLVMGTLRGCRMVAGNRYDLINTHFVLPTGPVGDALARRARIPNVLSLHGGDLYDPAKRTSPHRHPLLRAWIRHLLRRADLVIGQSTNTLENMRRFYANVPALRIPLAIPRPPLAVGSREAYGLGMDEIVLVTVGRLVARKALDQLITLMTRLRGRNVRLLVIGSGPEEPRLQEAIRAADLRGSVRLLGSVNEHEKFRVLRLSDVYVSTSQHEGFGLVFLEAMATGLPIVCYDHGGQTDFLSQGKTGYLVPLNDLDGFQEHCETLIADADLRGEIGRANLQLVEEFFIETCAARYEDALSRVVERRRHVAVGV